MNFRRIAGVVLCLASVLGAQERRTSRALPDFDIRVALGQLAAPAADTVTARDLVSRRGVRARLTRTADGRIKSLSGDSAALTFPSTKAREQIVRDFLQAESALFSFLPQNRDRLRLLATDDSSGLSVLNFQQHQAGVPVYEATLKAGIGRTGELIRLDSARLSGELSANTTATLTAPQAIEAAYRANQLTLPGAIGNPTTRDGRQFYPIANGPEIPLEQTLLATSATAGRLAYRLFIDAGPAADYEMLIDARDGSLLLRRNLLRHAGQARIWKQSPLEGARTLVDIPDGWLTAGAVVTTGNNVDAYVDANGDGFADSTVLAGLQNGRAFSAAQVFDFPAPETAGLKPADFKPASVTNLFNLVNTAHDYFYSLGFTEAAGNFQTDNFGRGGAGNDAVIARAQAGDESDNASFAPRPDGLAGILRVGIWFGPTATSDSRDADYDGTVVFHEMGHGVSSRLVGGPTNTGCLFGLQSDAMGEGWSDYFASSYYSNPILSAYAAQTAVGIRRQPYNSYTFTYEDLGNEDFEGHNDGEIWAATLLDLRTAIGSAPVTDKLVVAALKLTPCNPSMVDARDAIVQADQAINGGTNLPKIWATFARHGLGYSARGADSPFRVGLNYTAFYLAAFDLPPGLSSGNQPPIITAEALPTLTLGTPFTYPIQAADPERGALSYKLLAGPPGMFVNASTGVLQWTPTFTSLRAAVEVKDAQGARAVLGFLLGVDTALGFSGSASVSGPKDSNGFATFDVAAGTQAVQLVFEGSTGDADFFLFDPSGALVSYEAQGGVFETGMISQPKVGRWTAVVLGYSSYQGNLRVLIPGVTPISLAAPQQTSGRISSQKIYKISIPPYTPQLVIQTSGGTGDVDLFAARGYIPACETFIGIYCKFDSRSSQDGNAEKITVSNPVVGDWYITLTGYDDYADVTLIATATPPAGLLPSQSSLTFYTKVGVAPTPQTFLIGADASITDFTWTATATAAVTSWFAGSPNTGRKGTALTIAPVVTGLAAGTYLATVTITAPGIPGSPRQIGVTLVVSPASVTLPGITGVINDANFASGPISPGSWITIRGTALAATTRYWTNADFNGAFLPTVLDNVRVKVNGKDALVYYISPTRIDVLAPDDDALGPVPVTVTNAQGSSAFTAQLAAYSPGFFLFEPNDRKYIAAVHSDGTLAGPAGLLGGTSVTRPVAVGGRVLLYATGFGPTNPARPANQLLVTPAPLPASAGLEITIGGVPANVEFAGLVSNGQYQFNVVIPNVPDGDQPVIAKVGGVSSPAGSYLRIGTQ